MNSDNPLVKMAYIKENNISLSNVKDSSLNKQVKAALLDESYKEEFFRRIFETDTSDYSKFNDIEMIYLYVHQEKDQDEEKNTQQNTKKEYVRELLHVYLLLNNNRDQFGIPFNTNGDLFRTLKEKHIRLYQQWLKTAPLGKGNKPYSIATISRKTTIFKSFLLYLYNKQYITLPIHKVFIAAKVSKKDRPNRDMSKKEVIQLLEYYRTNPIVHGFLSILVTTGARIEEICSAKVSDLTYEKDEKSNQSHYWLEVTGKGNKNRSLLIHGNVFEAIMRFRRRRRLDTTLNPIDHSPLFTTAKGKAYQYKNLSMFLTKHIREADVPFIQINNQLKEQIDAGLLPDKDKKRIRSLSPHTLRHAFAIISAENNSDVFRIMQSLGHEKIETTMIYLENKQSKEQNVGQDWKGNEIMNYI